jgi:hypothetical protein
MLRPGSVLSIYICASEVLANAGINLDGWKMPFSSSNIPNSSVEAIFSSSAFETGNQVYI